VWLALLAGIGYFFLLGRAPLSNPDEGRYAEISREMVATGDWTTPRLDGVRYFEKPPLMYWAVAAAEELLGPGEWSVRTAVALFAVGGIAITYIAGRVLYGRRAGIWSAVALGTSLLYFALGHILLLDTAVSVLMGAALFFFLLGIRAGPNGRADADGRPNEEARASDSEGRDGRPARPDAAEATPARRPCFYGFYACAALATLTKGLIGFLIPGAVIFLWLLVFNQWRRLRPFYLPTGMLLFLAIAAPWHLVMASRNPAWARFYFIHEHLQRFATSEAHRVQPWWFYIPIVLLGIFPWTGFLWPALRDALAGGWARRDKNADAWFLVTWVVFIFLFFSASRSKLIPYILPVFPPLAVLVGASLGRGRQGRDGTPIPASLAPYVVFTCISWLLAAALLIAVLKPGVIREPGQALALQPWALGLALMLAVWSAITLFVAKRGQVVHCTLPQRKGTMYNLTPLSCVLATTSILLGVLVVVRPAIDIRGTKPLAVEVAALAQPGDSIYSYHGFFHDFAYYSQRTVGLVEYHDELEPENDDPSAMARIFISDSELRRQWAGSGRIFVVARKQSVRELFADPAFHYRLLGSDPGHYLFSNR
jgi:4-amino-4-deoxy-L-arabinose transferase-like glycosyltransferase